jgi:Pyruvate kinase
MNQIIHETKMNNYYDPTPNKIVNKRTNITKTITHNTYNIAKSIGTRMIVTFTESNNTTHYTSKHQPMIPIITFSPNETTHRKLALLWNIIPFPTKMLQNTDEMMHRTNNFILTQNFISPGNRIITIFGTPIDISNTTNSIQIMMME